MDACVPGDEVPETGDYDLYAMQNISALAQPRDIPTWEITFKLTFYVVVLAIDIVGNSIVALIILINKRMRSTTNLLILNLAISDIMVGVFCMWVHAGNSVTKEWPFDNYVCKGNIFMQVCAVISSILTLTAISAERFFAIIYPFKHRRSPYFTAMIISINWIISIGMASPLLVVRRRFELYWADRHQVWCEEVWPKYYADSGCVNTYSPGRTIYYAIVVVVMYFIPVMVMVFTYSIISVKLLYRKRPGATITSTNQAQFRYRKKVIRMLVAVLISFIVCWTPHQTLILWDIFRDRSVKITNNEYIAKIQYTAVFIAYFNSALNPIMYGGFNENFRKGFKDAFTCLLLKKRRSVVPFRPNRAAAERPMQGSDENTTPMGTSNV